jgi:hypothetical protein
MDPGGGAVGDPASDSPAASIRDRRAIACAECHLSEDPMAREKSSSNRKKLSELTQAAIKERRDRAIARGTPVLRFRSDEHANQEIKAVIEKVRRDPEQLAAGIIEALAARSDEDPPEGC